MKRVISLLLILLVFLTSCNGGGEDSDNYSTVTVNGSFAAKSDTGLDVVSTFGDSKKSVGLFYSIWHGAHISFPTGTYDNTKILENVGSLVGKDGITIFDWMDNGGGNRSTFHWWGKPLFGYYTTTDEWVLSRHVQMLTDSGVDYLVIDFTNGTFPPLASDKRDASYTDRLLLLFKSLDRYYQQGYNVPKVVCYTYYKWENTVNALYEEVYKAHPEYSHLWYHWGNNEKPLIIGNTKGYGASFDGLKKECEVFFDIKDGAFPHETKNKDLIPEIATNESILWMDFRPVPEKQIVDGVSYVSISTSEINVTNRASEQWFGDSRDRTKSWDGTKNRNWLENEEDAYLYGINFERQFKEAIKQDPDTIIITGWNEWIAELQYNSSTKKIGFVDVADINNNRDIEPMEGGYGDNYYMQLTYWIGKFKGSSAKVNAGKNVTIDINGSFDQWKSNNITAVYKDYLEDIFDRNSFEAYNWSETYTDSTGVNDFESFKVAKDSKNIYFYAKTVDNVIMGSNLMTLFLSTNEDKGNWYGYNYVVNRGDLDNDKMVLEKRDNNSWSKVGVLECKVEGNELMVKVPMDLIEVKEKDINIMFKWADNYEDENIWSFYTRGDAAPYGRLNYVFK